ncbi:hypothetical protein M5X06_23560 [Paenibacillus alvei]|nr:MULTISPECIES: hypothetical protein [Paenibacillus]MCY9769763.1 hypothetical protein [Paenibacillus alvei]
MNVKRSQLILTNDVSFIQPPAHDQSQPLRHRVPIASRHILTQFSEIAG